MVSNTWWSSFFPVSIRWITFSQASTTSSRKFRPLGWAISQQTRGQPDGPIFPRGRTVGIGLTGGPLAAAGMGKQL